MTEITHNSAKSESKLEFVNWTADQKITSNEDYIKLNELLRLKLKIAEINTKDLKYSEEQLKVVFKFIYLEREKNNLKHLLSCQSLSLYPDYKNRLEVLRMLNYVDNKYTG